MKRTKIIKAIQKALQGMTPIVEVKLYGSEARGDARPDSDIDLLILVDKDDISTEDELNITDPLYKIELETGILINPFILPMQKVLYFNNLFYINDLYMYMCLLRDKLGTKIGVKNAKKNKYRH